ncbi:hypothetical protein BDP27DRAFT_1394208 [Rhodocollybia butyracea]|uniref:Uncharacterized protein n=1 Tax=Rhodocollybia butyracea TaxID=206335 RepID=A0A9P5U1J5_9AGAR|nr:hypothetical protein BDP27DRAFT_1394208 [Rhodocollybia butyracea]
METALFVGGGALLSAFAARHFLRRGKGAADQWVKGGFKGKMDRTEAVSILGLRDGPKLRMQLKDAHRQIMLANHRIEELNEAKDLLEKDKRR